MLPRHAALCGARRQHIDIDQALNDVCAAVPEANPEPRLPGGAAAAAPGHQYRHQGWAAMSGNPGGGLLRPSTLGQVQGVVYDVVV